MTKRRLLVIMVALMLILTGVLAGCSPAEEDVNGETTKVTKAPKKEEAPKEEEEAEEIPELTWYLRTDEPPRADAVEDALDVYTVAEIGATVDYKFITPGDYRDKIGLFASSGEVFDMCYTATWAIAYLDLASGGAFVELDDKLDSIPETKALFSEELWNISKVNGHIYGVMNNQVMYNQPGLWFEKSMVEKYGMNIGSDTVIDEITDLEQYFDIIVENEPNMIPMLTPPFISAYSAMDVVQDEVYGVSFYEADMNGSEYVGITQAFTQEYADFAVLMREWNEKGYFAVDVGNIKDETSLLMSNEVFCRYNRQKPGTAAELGMIYGYDVISVPTGPMAITAGAVQSTYTSISRTSENIDKSLQLINLANTNADFYNVLIYGVEGEDYTLDGNGRVVPGKDAYKVPGWQTGNVFQSLKLPTQTATVWEETDTQNRAARVSLVSSVPVIVDSFETEWANVSAVNKEYNVILQSGLSPDPLGTLEEYREKLTTAGIDVIVAEVTKQVNDYLN